jgi:hypothetical protein
MTSPVWRSNGGRWSLAAGGLRRVVEKAAIDLL